jgi:hypothetical protein
MKTYFALSIQGNAAWTGPSADDEGLISCVGHAIWHGSWCHARYEGQCGPAGRDGRDNVWVGMFG